MSALTDAFVLDHLHGIRHTVGKSISGLHDIAGLYCYCTYTWRIYRIGTDCYVVASLRSRTNRRHAAINLREHCAARECRGRKEHARYGVEPCGLVLSVWVLALFAAHTAAVLRIRKYLIINKLEQMVRMINLDIYSLYIAYECLLYYLGFSLCGPV